MSQNRRIIIISYSAATLVGLFRLLRERGFRVEVAEQVEAALELPALPTPALLVVEKSQCLSQNCRALRAHFHASVTRMEPARSKSSQRKLAAELESYVDEAEAAPPALASERIHPAQVQRAKDIQSHLFPATTTSVGLWELAFEWQPSRSVGGDLCWYSESEGSLLVALVDVMGHGYPAAIIVGMMSAVLDTLQELDEETLASTNRFLCEKTPKDTSVALTLVQLDRRSGKALVCCAGNPAPIRLDPRTGTSVQVCQPQPAMGWLDTFAYRLEEITVPAGQALVCHTDGLDPEKVRELPLKRSLKAYVTTCLRQARSQTPDDRAIIALRRDSQAKP